MMNLTKREKFLLGMLAVITVISVYVVFLLLPLYNDFNLNKKSLTEQESLHKTMDETVARYGTYDQELLDAKTIADEKLGEILPGQVNDKVYDYLITLAEASGNKIIGSTITDHAIMLVSPEIPVEAEADPEVITTYSLKDALYLVNGIQLPEEFNLIINEVYLDVNLINIEISGNQETVGAFLDSIINESKTMKTVGLARNAKDGTFTVTVKVYSTQGME